MNKTERMLAIVLELQRGGGRRAEDLAATFETSVRTIYRDMEALSEAGVPLVATPGRGYALMPGYFLPPVAFTVDEATALLLGGDVVAGQFDPQYRAVAESAQRKLAAVLPAGLRAATDERRARLRFVSPWPPAPEVEEHLRLLRRAVLEGAGVSFRYHGWRNTREGSPPTEREADPYALVSFAGVWMLVAYDHLREAVRRFRLDRMEGVSLTGRTFTPPVSVERGEDTPRPVVVRALFDPAIARRVREYPAFSITTYEEREDGLLVTLRVREAADAVQWLLGWGRYVHVLAPESVRRLLADEAAAVLARHAEMPVHS